MCGQYDFITLELKVSLLGALKQQFTTGSVRDCDHIKKEKTFF